jgi:hypothetical protein
MRPWKVLYPGLAQKLAARETECRLFRNEEPIYCRSFYTGSPLAGRCDRYSLVIFTLDMLEQCEAYYPNL